MSTSKEKRTKEQVMQLLDRAIEQEEVLLERVKVLEVKLADCQQKVENPRHELDEQATPGSKVSFRLDFYRTEDRGALKGIVEHLSTRESRSFEGINFDEVSKFLVQFVGVPTEQSLLETTDVISEDPTIHPSETTPVDGLITPPFKVLTEDALENKRAVLKGHPFFIEIPMQSLDKFQGKPCSVTLTSKSLDRVANYVEIVEYCTPAQDKLRIPVNTLTSEQGIYRLEVTMTLRDEPQSACYREGRLLIVQ